MEEKQIPIYFDNVTITAPAQLISNQNQKLARLRVAAFTRYGNRNGSYITNEVADMLIASATTGTVPVIGFFDPATQKWAGHTGSKIANAYGYVENFIGWEPLKDTDGITREYAIFSVILFTDYFEEATKILGQNQSMELNPDFIDGAWADIDGIEYYVYKQAKMLGFCIIGDHEPCFSVSTFFSKDDNTYTTQFDKFASLLSDLKAQVEEAEKGGTQPMNEFEQEVSTENAEEIQAAVETTVVEDTPADNSTVESVEESEVAADFETEVENTESEPVAEQEATAEPSELETLRAEFEKLQTTYQELQAATEPLQQQLAEAMNQIEALTTQVSDLKSTIATYEAQAAEQQAAENNAKKEELLNSYASLISGEEITQIKETVDDMSYDELESKLAVTFARQQLTAKEEINKVPLLEPEESSFALFMKKYKKN